MNVLRLLGDTQHSIDPAMFPLSIVDRMFTGCPEDSEVGIPLDVREYERHD